MNKPKNITQQIITTLTSSLFLIVSCTPSASKLNGISTPETDLSQDALSLAVSPTPLPARKNYTPGELVDYTAQTGDSLPALALRFSTTVDEILLVNPQIP